jgi:hypothetical protein
VKKVIFPLVVALALVASVSAGAYTAAFTMDIDPVVESTSGAELAFAAASGSVGNNFIQPGNNPLQVKMVFGQVQPDSEYRYEECLKVTNNKPYDVGLAVASVSIPEPLFSYCDFQIWEADYPWKTQYESWGGTVQPWTHTFHLGAGQSTYLSFRLRMHGTAAAGTFIGTTTFKAEKWEPK